MISTEQRGSGNPTIQYTRLFYFYALLIPISFPADAWTVSTRSCAYRYRRSSKRVLTPPPAVSSLELQSLKNTKLCSQS